MNSLAGVAELSAKLDAMIDRRAAKGILRAAARAGIKPALVRAISTIPAGHRAHRTYKGRIVAPGFSRRSIRSIVVVSLNGSDVQAHLGVRKEAFYAVQFTERGTEKMGERPWLKPAFEQTLEQQKSEMARVLRERIEAIAAGGGG